MNVNMTELNKLLEEKKKARKKPIETEMYWWLNANRPFYIGDEYQIILEKIDSGNKSARIKIINLKNCDSKSSSDADVSLQELIALHDVSGGE